MFTLEPPSTLVTAEEPNGARRHFHGSTQTSHAHAWMYFANLFLEEKKKLSLTRAMTLQKAAVCVCVCVFSHNPSFTASSEICETGFAPGLTCVCCRSLRRLLSPTPAEQLQAKNKQKKKPTWPGRRQERGFIKQRASSPLWPHSASAAYTTFIKPLLKRCAGKNTEGAAKPPILMRVNLIHFHLQGENE